MTAQKVNQQKKKKLVQQTLMTRYKPWILSKSEEICGEVSNNLTHSDTRKSTQCIPAEIDPLSSTNCLVGNLKDQRHA